MEQNPSWQANSHSTSHEIARLLWKPKVLHGFQNSLPSRTLSWARWIQSTPSHNVSLRSILILSYYLRRDLPSGIFPSSFPTKIVNAFLTFHTHATCPAYLILLYLITIIIFGEAYKFNIALQYAGLLSSMWHVIQSQGTWKIKYWSTNYLT
jgi:hypothetical protein